MRAKIKICGLRRIEDAYIINNFPEIKYAGLVLTNSSKRFVNMETAKAIKKLLRPDIKTVGVFADMSVGDINRAIEEIGLDVAQLHSRETDSDCSQIMGAEIWKSIAVSTKEDLYKADDYTFVDGFVLDSASNGMWGGSGNTFNWEFANGFSSGHFLVLAGGIDADNVARAVFETNPNVIDLSSSVETDGFKDYAKIQAFVEATRGID